MKGKIRTLKADKGFGFIKGEDGVEYFFHQSALLNIRMDELSERQEVNFEPSEGTKGPRAEDITA